MHIEYAMIRGCKRFHLTKIREIEATFPKRVTVISGISGTGKSSWLHELCPLPAVRTAYDRDGVKEIHLSHEGHQYELLSDFTNRVSPHSFKRDGIELNQGHTTDVQEELVIKYLGLTPAIRNLIYNKTTICSLTKAERRNLFLTINPMDLRLVLAAHKAAQGKFKDAKAQLQLLYSRKTDLENRMLDALILEQHRKTQDELNHELNEIDKILYTLDQHMQRLRDEFQSDLAYRQHCLDNNQKLIPGDNIIHRCLEISRTASKFASVTRGDGFENSKSELQVQQQALRAQKENIRKSIESLTREVDEYQHCIENASGESVSDLEHELSFVSQSISEFGELPETPIPQAEWDRYQHGLDMLCEILYVFRDSEVKMIPVTELTQRMSSVDRLSQSINQLSSERQRIQQLIDEQHAELEHNHQRANIPATCNASTCGLRMIFTRRMNTVEQQYQQNVKRRDELDQQLSSFRTELDQLRHELEPYQRNHLLERYTELLQRLSTGYYAIHDWSQVLLGRLNTQPMLIHAELEQRLTQSRQWYERDKLLQRKQYLTTKLETLMKSSGTSLEFLQSKVAEKEQAIKQDLEKYNQLDAAEHTVGQEYALYLEYAAVTNELTSFYRTFQQGERALVISKSLEYWSDLSQKFLQAKRIISEELRKLDTIVREQEMIRHTYETEILHLVDQVEQDRITYDKIESALSPYTGIPHKSMVRYLNALIHNVNYFLTQVWSYPMKIREFDPDAPLDYGLRIDVANTPIADLSQLSEGQTEITNFMWVLTILLQLKMLDKIPLYTDELGRAFDANHRLKLLTFLNELIDNNYIDQLFLVSHYAEFIHGFTDADIIHFGTESSSELPQNTNEHIRFVYG